MNDKKSRAYLKSLFRAGSIPTDADFSKLIDSSFNPADDQLEFRSNGTKGQSICIGAGENQVLLSFFASLSQAGSNWTLELQPENSLSFFTKNRSKPVLTLDQLGRVGIGTDRPSTTLDVKGDISAANQSLSGSLFVQGMATVSSLRIQGVGTIKEVADLRNILGLPTPADSATPVTPAPASTPAPAQPSITAPSSSVRQDTPKVVRLDETAASKSWQTCTVQAQRTWQNVLGPYTGAKALELIAHLDGAKNRSVCHLTAVNIDGDPNPYALHHVHSYQGRPGSKVYFRWEQQDGSYFLQCRTSLRHPAGTSIYIYYHVLL